MFHDVFPQYLAMGMSAEEFWDGDPILARDYRKAFELKRKQKNEQLWLQGMYVYEALCCASPLMQPFAKSGTKAHPYSAEPYPLTEKEEKERKERDERKLMQKGIEKMKRMAAQFNQKFKKQGDE